ncbi:MAG: hypothetical protein V3S01_13300 [Dehalococcoidia bacterium]
MSKRAEIAAEHLAEGLCEAAKHFCDKAKEGHATAADIAIALKLLSHMGGELRDDAPDVIITRDEIMESLKDLDLDDLH